MVTYVANVLLLFLFYSFKFVLVLNLATCHCSEGHYSDFICCLKNFNF